MPTKCPRKFSVEPPIHSAMQNIARLEESLCSAVARDLIKKAICFVKMLLSPVLLKKEKNFYA